MLEKVKKEMTAVSAIGNGEYVVASFVMLGRAYRNVMNFFLHAPVPKNLKTAALRRQFRLQLQKQSSPFKQTAEKNTFTWHLW